MIRRLQMEENYSTTVEIESMDEIIRLFGVFDENLKVIEAETGARIPRASSLKARRKRYRSPQA